MPSFAFPFHAEDLDSGAFWFRTGTDGWDMHAQRRTSGGWTKYRSNAQSPPRNENALCYDAPVYALTDGEVLSAWRMAPDNDRPGVKDPRNTRLGGKGISRSGNHVSVLADDGSVILYAHLVPETVPRGLCREPDKAIMDNANARVHGTNDNEPGPVVDGVASISLPAESAWTSSVGRPRVTQGQVLGRVGNFGNSSEPHIHLSRNTNAGVPTPFGHHLAWRSTQADPSAWVPFTGQVLGATDKSTVVHASPLLRRGQASRGGIGEVALHFVRSRRAVSALRGATGDLKLITWGMSASGDLAPRGEISAGRASAIALAEPRSDLIVTALRDAAGDLRLISWLVKNNGELERCGQAHAGPVSRISLVSAHEGVVVVAVRSAEGSLKLIAWRVAPNGDFSRGGQATGEAVTELAMTSAPAVRGVVTSARASTGRLRLDTWRVSTDGRTISHRGEGHAGAVDAVDVTTRGDEGQFAVTAVRDQAGDLRVIAWEVTDDGTRIERRGTGTAGTVAEARIAPVVRGGLSTVVACRDGAGRLRLLDWQLSQDGRTVSRWGGALAGPASRVAVTSTTDSGRDYLLTACADSTGDLKLITWEANI